MPTNKNAMTRYQALDELLSDKYHDYSLDDLTMEVNRRLNDMGIESVTRRCIEKDIHYLEHEGPFYVEIARYTTGGYDAERDRSIAKKCLRYATPSFSIFKKEMTDEEKYLLSELLSLVGQFEGLPNLGNLENLRQHIDVPYSKEIVSLSVNPLMGSTIFGQLFSAIAHKQTIKIDYHTYAAPEITKSIVAFPYLLKEYNLRWYLFAGMECDRQLLCFALDRIEQVVPMTARQYIEYDGDLNEYFEDIIGVTLHRERPIEHILFWVSSQSDGYVQSKPLHGSQKCYHGKTADELHEQYPMLQGGTFFSIDCIENYELIRALMSFGKELLVLSPQSIQHKIMDTILQMDAEYSILRTKSS